jgi:asparaginyl-tRNA synthetase
LERLLIKDALSEEHIGKSLTICGWVRTKRESKGFAFLVVGDGSSQDTLQLIIPDEIPAFHELQRLNTGAAIRATGVLKESPARGQKFEMEVLDILVFGEAEPATYPLQKKGHTLEFLREICHLRPRTNTFGAVFRLRNILAASVHEFFQSRGFVWIHTPIITASDCEGAGDLFTVTSFNLLNPPKNNGGDIDFSQDFFGRRAYLTVSGQLEAEFLAMSLGRVYTFGPTFRAENSNTTRHLSEFWMIEPEMAFADLQDDMKLSEDFFRFLCRRVIEKGERELAFLEGQYKKISREDLARLAETSFTHISYTDAIKELKTAKETFEFPVSWGADLQSEHERYLTDQVIKGPLIVTDYPKGIKPFYMRLNPDGETVAAMDVLVPKVGEIIGGSQREERLDVLEGRMKETGIPMKNLQWYLDLRRFGSAPHAGFGLGFERLVQFITGMVNIRDVIPCPRAPRTIGF